MYAEIKFNLIFYDINKKELASIFFKRVIKFNKWDNEYIVLDSDNSFKKYSSFYNLKESINRFDNLEVELINKLIDDFVIIKGKYFLKSIEVIPPFKFLEFTRKFGNIKKTMQIKYNLKR